MNKYMIRTDLAQEAVEGLSIKEETKNINGIELKRIFVDEDTEKKINKKKGVYYTLDTRAIKTHDNDDMENCIMVLSSVIKEILEIENINEKSKGLIVGLGNINVTPDSLGPLVVDNVMVTRHMFIVDSSKVSPGISEVSAIAPGVMGTTGIETKDIIEAVVKNVDIDYMIVVDALCSRAIDRVNKTIQVTNTGICPGSGVGNKRKELNKETLGIPVIAIGVPTVVDALTITIDTIDYVINKIKEEANQKIDNETMFGKIGSLSNNEKRQLVDEILTPAGLNMMVTPKEVDLDISDLTEIISKAIDKALHPLIS